MKQKTKKYLFGSLIFVFVAAFGIASVALFTGRDRADAIADEAQEQSSVVSSRFSFTGVENWTKGPSNETSLAAFHEGSDNCFVSAEYITGSLDESSALQKVIEPFTTTGYAVTPQSDVTMYTLVDGKQQEYQLHQYTVKATSSTPAVKEGNEFGFISVKNGYIKVEGHCDTSAELPVTVPALQAIEFSTTN